MLWSHRQQYSSLGSNNLRNFSLIIIVAILGIHTLGYANGEQPTMKFRYTYQIAPEILQDYCKDSFFKVSILKNSNKQIGGYVLQPAIRDAPIPYLDCDG